MRKSLRQKQVIRVHKGHPFAARRVHPRVARAGNARVFLMQNADAGILSGKRIENRAGAIFGTVVHGDQFKILHGLRKHAFHRAGKRLFRAVAGHHDAHKRRIHGSLSLGARRQAAASPSFRRITCMGQISG